MKTMCCFFVLVAISSLCAAESRPNVLIILADDLGWGELGCQGFTREIPTPQIDSLATNGIRCTNGYVSGPYCSPTRAGLMTGRYQQRFGHEFNPGPAESAVENFGLSLSEQTIANRMKSEGYATGWIGKSHLGYQPPYHPLQRGFDYFYGFLGGAHDYLDARSDAHNPILRGLETVNEMGYATEDFGKQAADFIDRSQGHPWLCYLAFNAVHSPLQAPEIYEKRFAGIEDKRRRTFAAMLSAMDDAVGTVLSKVRALNAEENTLIFFISDNGGPTPSTTSSNGPLRGFKAQTWEGGIRVPFIVQWKSKLPAGKIETRPVIQLDVLPTALSAASIELKTEWKLDGVNLLPFLSGDKGEEPHQALYWRFGQQIAIRSGDWKLVKGIGSLGVEGVERRSKVTTENAELYNLKEDIGEKVNLAGKEPEKFKALASDWDQWNATLVEPSWIPNRQKNATKAGKAGKTKKKAVSQ
ncbi:MAG: sulfatase-like hydrolase/transferase [Pirellulaceae bacterium]|nr:sulfatase-like hydrolase/transferase [Pirellulaceae bacterium]